jgi:hypothetical protein
VWEFDAAVTHLRKEGTLVKIRDVKTVPNRAIGTGAFDGDVRQLEELTPIVTLTSYFAEEVNRRAMSNATVQEVLQTGIDLLDEMEDMK